MKCHNSIATFPLSKNTMVKSNNNKASKVTKTAGSRVSEDINNENTAPPPSDSDNEGSVNLGSFSEEGVIRSSTVAVENVTDIASEIEVASPDPRAYDHMVRRTFRVKKLQPVVDRKFLDSAGVSVMKCVLNVEIVLADGTQMIIVIWGANANNFHDWLE
jgi:hypothetical protein